MDPMYSIITIIAGLVAFGLIWRSVSTSPEKTTGGQPEPSPYDPEALENLTKVQLLEVGNSLGLELPKSWTKAKLVQAIINATNSN